MHRRKDRRELRRREKLDRQLPSSRARHRGHRHVGDVAGPDLARRLCRSDQTRDHSRRGAFHDDASWELARPKLALLVERSLAIKAAIVAADERERNDIRALLNFGHTIGHAIEFAAGYGELLHGEALSLGIVAAAHVSMRRAGLASGAADQIRAALQAHHLPTALMSDFPRMKIFDALPLDKKFVNGRIRFVVAHGIGQASVAEGITMEDLRAAVDAL